MIAVITGDIIASRSLKNQSIWLHPLEKFLSTIGDSPKDWEIFRGDSFQIEIPQPEDALVVALQIKSLLKSLHTGKSDKLKSDLDVRMAIGIGEKQYSSDQVSHNNGSAYINSGEAFDTLKKGRSTLKLSSGKKEFDEPWNIQLGFAANAISSWTIATAELMGILLENPKMTQQEIGKMLGIKQSSVSDRYRGAHLEDFLRLEEYYRKMISTLT